MDSVDGHMVIGNGRIIKREKDKTFLECGCILTQVERIGHIWKIELDFSKCKDHVCDDQCRK